MNIPILNPKKHKMPDGTWMMEGSMPGNEKLAIGIDPGINFGMTIINMEYVQVFWGRLKITKEDAAKPGLKGLAAYDYIKNGMLDQSRYFSSKAVVEGAAYGRPHRQVELEEERFGFYLALKHLGFDVVIMPPASIRLKAFGNGKLSAVDVYPSRNQNAVDSVGCAIAALKLYDE